MLRALLILMAASVCNALSNIPRVALDCPRRLTPGLQATARAQQWHKRMSLRGGEEATADDVQAAEEIAPTSFAAQLYAALRDNKSLDPNDHPSSLQWALAGEL